MENNGKIKSGFKTTEFWVIILVVILPFVNAKLGTSLEVEGAAKAIVDIIIGVGQVVCAVTYIISRTKLKK